MATATIYPPRGVVRRRKAHKKSRGGCSNCKLRRVKCDEAKPRCHKCLDYGVDCSYDIQLDDDLQLSVTGTFKVDVPQVRALKTPSLNNADIGVLNHSLAEGYSDFPFPTYHLSEADFNILKRFQTRTVRTIGTANLFNVYKNDILRLASCNPFLMHTLLALTLMHDRYIEKSNKLSVAEAYHSHQGTMLFNHILNRPIKPAERDAVWACAGLFGAITFCAVEVNSPEDAWPLRPSTYQDLDWLSISDGKKEIARLAYPEGSESIFYTTGVQTYVGMIEKVSESDCRFDAFPDGFIDYFSLTPCSKPNGNLYHRAAAILDVLLPMECNYSTIISFFLFIGHVPPEYKGLLHEKDPRALLLLAYWYAKLCEYDQWWISKRVLIECQAICIYLRRYHWQNATLLKLLKYPISRCGLTGSAETANKHWMFPM